MRRMVVLLTLGARPACTWPENLLTRHLVYHLLSNLPLQFPKYGEKMRGQKPHCLDEMPPVLKIEGKCSHFRSFTIWVTQSIGGDVIGDVIKESNLTATPYEEIKRAIMKAAVAASPPMSVVCKPLRMGFAPVKCPLI